MFVEEMYQPVQACPYDGIFGKSFAMGRPCVISLPHALQ